MMMIGKVTMKEHSDDVMAVALLYWYTLGMVNP